MDKIRKIENKYLLEQKDIELGITKAKEELGWQAQYGIEEMCRDAWNWQKNNPNGYED